MQSECHQLKDEVEKLKEELEQGKGKKYIPAAEVEKFLRQYTPPGAQNQNTSAKRSRPTQDQPSRRRRSPDSDREVVDIDI